jgi:hypothetical protein
MMGPTASRAGYTMRLENCLHANTIRAGGRTPTCAGRADQSAVATVGRSKAAVQAPGGRVSLHGRRPNVARPDPLKVKGARLDHEPPRARCHPRYPGP